MKPLDHPAAVTLAAFVRPIPAQQVEKPSEERFFDWTALQFDVEACTMGDATN